MSASLDSRMVHVFGIVQSSPPKGLSLRISVHYYGFTRLSSGLDLLEVRDPRMSDILSPKVSVENFGKNVHGREEMFFFFF